MGNDALRRAVDGLRAVIDAKDLRTAKALAADTLSLIVQDVQLTGAHVPRCPQ